MIISSIKDVLSFINDKIKEEAAKDMCEEQRTRITLLQELKKEIQAGVQERKDSLQNVVKSIEG